MKCDKCEREIPNDDPQGPQSCNCGVIVCPECWAEHADECEIALEEGPIE